MAVHEQRMCEFENVFLTSLRTLVGKSTLNISVDRKALFNEIGPILFDNRNLLYERSDAIFDNEQMADVVKNLLKDSIPILYIPGSMRLIMQRAKTNVLKDEIFNSLLELLKIYVISILETRKSDVR